jgi:hypothetical protein
VFQSRIESRLSELLPGAPNGLGDAVSSGGVDAAVGAAKAAPGGGPSPDQVATASKIAFVGALNDILLIGALVAFVGAALGFALVRSRDFVPQGAPETAPEAEPEPVAA